ncbi:MAG: hypothetical protein F6K09_22805 [Merismopedia sp. SIO2A8]|nr:hypothetical protein [Merismopedia sp. SIO2A8]
MESFDLGGSTYTRQGQAQVIFRRNDNNNFTGTVRRLWFDSVLPDNQIVNNAPNIDVRSSFEGSEEDILSGPIINRGSDATFDNDLATTERIDFIYGQSMKVTSTGDLGESGFAIFERGGNDSFKIAAITALDSNGNPADYGNLIEVQDNQWGDTGFDVNTYFMSQNVDAGDATLRPDDHFGSQDVTGVFVSFDDLGVAADQTIYGYSIFDTNTTGSGTELVDWTDRNHFPDATASSLDLTPSGLIFTSENVTSFVVDTDGDGQDDSTDICRGNGWHSCCPDFSLRIPRRRSCQRPLAATLANPHSI